MISLHANTNLIAGLAGGAIIALSSSALLYFTGKITGISGIAHSFIHGRSGGTTSWRSSYILGLLGAGVLLRYNYPSAFGSAAASALRPEVLAAAGLLVGFGARLGSGCTSGHGVCGLPRLSPRSLAAVGTFMTTGAITAAAARSSALAPLLTRSAAAAASASGLAGMANWTGAWVALPSAAVLLALAIITGRIKLWPAPSTAAAPAAPAAKGVTAPHRDSLAVHAASFFAALVFGIGLGISGMTDPAKVSAFLDFMGPGGWDPSLMGVMGAGVVLNAITFRWAYTGKMKPLLADHTAEDQGKDLGQILSYGPSCPANRKIDWKLLLGSAIFGAGWGLAGVCPGPAIVAVAGGVGSMAPLVPGMMAGMAMYEATFGDGLLHHHRHHHHHHHAHHAKPGAAPAAAAAAGPAASATAADIPAQDDDGRQTTDAAAAAETKTEAHKQ